MKNKQNMSFTQEKRADRNALFMGYLGTILMTLDGINGFPVNRFLRSLWIV